MTKSRVLMIGFDGMQTLDVTGPAEVFAACNRVTGRELYEVIIASVGGGTRIASSGIGMRTVDLRRVRLRRDDIVLVSGGDDAAVRRALGSETLLAWIRRARSSARIVGSVCSGAFVLAASGILDGRRAATHWSGCALLARTFPNVTVDPDAIFVKDGSIWTSAGVTTGIDMALAMVEADHGRRIADAIAGRLVLYVRRPGFQSQFSDALVAQTSSDDGLDGALDWARENLGRADVTMLAKRAGLSVRTLHRRCLDALGTTPARLVDRLRVERARALLHARDLPTKRLAIESGFSGAAQMNRAFERELGMSPRDYRLLHGGQRAR